MGLSLSSDEIQSYDKSASFDAIYMQRNEQYLTFVLNPVFVGTMGSSLARNFSRHSCHLSLYNRHVQGIEELVAERLISRYADEFQSRAKGFENLELFVSSLAKPRIVILLVDSGSHSYPSNYSKKSIIVTKTCMCTSSLR